MQERLQKLLAAVGLASRRAAEDLIRAGRVTVDGRPARLGDKADPSTQDIRVDGKPLPREPRRVYIMMNKPAGYACTLSDPHAEQTVVSLLKGVRERVYPVGRLDVDTTGLLLLTNDGDLAYRLTHPRFKVPRTYVAKVVGVPTPSATSALMQGVTLEDGPASAVSVRVLSSHAYGMPRGRGHAVLEIIISQGRKRQVRRMLQAIGHPVIHLTRTAFGTLRLGSLKPGQWRHLTPGEVQDLLRLSGRSQPHTHGGNEPRGDHQQPQRARRSHR
ncbi:MAG: pseudouridine synthase [Armatimonadota bacterium]